MCYVLLLAADNVAFLEHIRGLPRYLVNEPQIKFATKVRPNSITSKLFFF